MKILISENRLKSLINKMVGYDLSDRIEMITSWVELNNGGHQVFRNREDFRFYLNHYGPFFMFNIGPHNKYRDRYYVQYQGKENGWFISGEGYHKKMDEYDFLKILGIENLGVGLNKIIDEYFEE